MSNDTNKSQQVTESDYWLLIKGQMYEINRELPRKTVIFLYLCLL